MPNSILIKNLFIIYIILIVFGIYNNALGAIKKDNVPEFIIPDKSSSLLESNKNFHNAKLLNNQNQKLLNDRLNYLSTLHAIKQKELEIITLQNELYTNKHKNKDIIIDGGNDIRKYEYKSSDLFKLLSTYVIDKVKYATVFDGANTFSISKGEKLKFWMVERIEKDRIILSQDSKNIEILMK